MITLATLAAATAQEVFTQGKEHLLQQNARSTKFSEFHGEDVCVFRGDNGLQCVGGCFMTDEQAARVGEGDRWHALPAKGVGVPHEHAELIDMMQLLHDLIMPWQWPEELRKLAQQRGLIY